MWGSIFQAAYLFYLKGSLKNKNRLVFCQTVFLRDGLSFRLPLGYKHEAA